MLSKLWKSNRPQNAHRAFDRDLLKRFRRDTHGGVLVYVGIMLPVLLAVSGLAMDASFWYVQKRSAQAIADTAAYSATQEVQRTGNETLAKSAAKNDAITNGLDESEGDSITFNFPPKNGDFAGMAGYYEVIIERPAPVFLSGLILPDDFNVAARAVGGTKSSGTPCVLSLEENDGDAIKVNNGSIFANGCAIQSNSGDDEALNVFKNGSVEADEINIVGDYVNTGYISSTPNTPMPAEKDPFYGLPTPPPSGCLETNLAFNSGSHILSPGTYCGGIALSGSASVTLQSGTYVIQGGNLQMSGANTSLEGSGVTLYTAEHSEIRIQGQGDIDLSAPTYGTYAGVLMYGDPLAATNTQHHINGDVNMIYEGFMYFPSAQLQFNGNGTGTTSAEYIGAIARVLEFGGNGELHFDYDADNTNVPTLPGSATLVE